jgi:hypothetical protein
LGLEIGEALGELDQFGDRLLDLGLGGGGPRLLVGCPRFGGGELDGESCLALACGS